MMSDHLIFDHSVGVVARKSHSRLCERSLSNPRKGPEYKPSVYGRDDDVPFYSSVMMLTLGPRVRNGTIIPDTFLTLYSSLIQIHKP